MTGQNCTDLSIVRIRAKITIGSYYYVTTGLDGNAAGDVISFSVNASRGQPTAKLSCQVAALFDRTGLIPEFGGDEENMGERIIVRAGSLLPEQEDDDFSSLPTLFTGYITSVRTSPHWSERDKQILDITAEDEFTKFQYQGKISRRFKVKDDAFAVITGGKRRQGGQMTKLKRVPAGRNGIDYIESGSTGNMEHSPLIKTPDYKAKTPSGAKAHNVKGSSENGESDSEQYRFDPPGKITMQQGQVSEFIVRDSTGDKVKLNDINSTTFCMCHVTPAPSYFDGSASTGTGLRFGQETYPIKITLTSDDKIRVVVTGTYPAVLTFVHPQDGGTCSLDFDVIPPHSHRDMSAGGPAVGVYDTYGV